MIDFKRRKRELRRRVRAQIDALDPADRRMQQAAIDRLLADLPGFARAATVLLYVSAFSEEVETGVLIRTSLALGKRLILPRVDPECDCLRLHPVADLDRDLIPGLKGIPEPRGVAQEVLPEAIDWVLVPGLAFNPKGDRLGRGRGHYDRLLSALRTETPRWALAFEPQWVDEIPVEAHDQRLDGIAGPSRIVETQARGSLVFRL